MRVFLLAVVLIAVICGAFVFPRLTGPRIYVFRVGELTEDPLTLNRLKVKSPSPYAWFGGFVLVVEKEQLQPQDSIELEVFQHGICVFREVVQVNRLMQQNANRKNSFVVFLSDGSGKGAAKKALGYGQEFEVSGRFLSSSKVQLGVYAKFLDDRLIKQ